jgi:branched-chain amino acid transport system permease protein
MAQIVSVTYLTAFSIALLILSSIGLAVIFGSMRIINLAHGEFMMIGGYTCVLCVSHGIPLWIAIVCAGIVTAACGIIIERLLIRFLYGRMIDTMLATWGLSLLLVGLATTLFGVSGRGISPVNGGVTVYGTTMSIYNLAMCVLALVVLALTWSIAKFTRFGILARGTMQNAEIARGMGANSSVIYMATFGFGTALAGIAGAALVPITGVSPTSGIFFIAKAFITVITGGPFPILGTLSAAAIFGTVDASVQYFYTSIAGEISILIIALILLRLLPQGITGKMQAGI